MPERSMIYRWLMARAVGDPFDGYVFACTLAVAAAEPRPLTEGLGLARSTLEEMLACHFSHAVALLDDLPPNASPGVDALEEPDLRRFLLDHRSMGTVQEEWLSHVIARRSLGMNHLWQDMGLSNRSDVSALLERHFHPLATKNAGSMKWKKFFYRQLCLQEDVLVCKSPVCEACDDFSLCFGDELPLIVLSGLFGPATGREVPYSHHRRHHIAR
ncbi:MAG: nitrogen fixation protein NifQ [Rhodospirillaceae bacterium]|nr:MAG: nitrogen fixation protein NifQ [Rhodospirillaceae bacterium]